MVFIYSDFQCLFIHFVSTFIYLFIITIKYISTSFKNIDYSIFNVNFTNILNVGVYLGDQWYTYCTCIEHHTTYRRNSERLNLPIFAETIPYQFVPTFQLVKKNNSCKKTDF